MKNIFKKLDIETSTKGGKESRLYRIWRAMNQRCKNKNHKYYCKYGGSGVAIEWENSLSFITDMLASYNDHCEEFGEKQTSIDRIDKVGNYSKSNCRWATRKEQANNRKQRIVRNLSIQD